MGFSGLAAQPRQSSARDLHLDGLAEAMSDNLCTVLVSLAVFAYFAWLAWLDYKRESDE